MGKHTNEELKALQSLELDEKIKVTTTRLLEWYNYWDGKCYVSFSGGKDSTVLANLAANVCKITNETLILWYSDTGLEYPEIRDFIGEIGEFLKNRYDIKVEVILDYPKDRQGKRITFRKVIEKFGYPIISKEVAQKIYEARKNPTGVCASRFKEGSDRETAYGGRYNMVKWNWLKDSDIPISHQCCRVMKKAPAKKFEHRTGLHPIIGTMTSESALRKKVWLDKGCNAFDGERPTSQPMSFWTEQDVLKYLKEYDLPYASVYGDIVQDENGKYRTTGCERTGCVYCGFGCHLEKEPNRFQKLKQTHPRLWEYCMKPWDKGGLGMREVLEYIGVKVE